jgi:membrane peptidoglycan carboxypeptidase
MPSVRFVTALATLARTGIIAGVVCAALLYPLVAIGGVGVKAGAEQLSGELESLKIAPLSQVSKVYASDARTLITQFYEEYRIPVSMASINPLMANAIVASEDARFFEHNGVDMRGIARAFVANQQAGEVSQGASTITMQYVRMTLRDSAQTPTEVHAATERTPARKLREMRLAIDLEKHASKPEILERYLNAAYFGHRAYGIYAAAEVYFSKRPADLTVGEAAMLAGLVQAPSAYDPASSDQAAARARRDYVVDRMAEMGYVAPADAAAAKAAPIALKLTEPPNDCVDVARAINDWGFFCDYFKTWWMGRPEYGASPLERLDKLRRGGYVVVTTLDPRAQAAAIRQVLQKEKMGSSFAHGIVAVEPGSGRVRSMAVNRLYSLDQSRNGRHTDPAKARKGLRGNYPATVNPLLGGGDLPGYQAGSTFKLFTLLAALEKGMPLSTQIDSPQRYRSRFRGEPGQPSTCGGSWWCPVNASASMSGRHTMWAGFGRSVNTFFVQLEERVGPEAAVRMAERLGLRWRTDIDKLQASPAKARTWGAFTLGVADTTPLEMAGAFATVAADGLYCQPLPMQSISEGAVSGQVAVGGPMPTQTPVTPRCERVISEDVARAAMDAARCVTGYGAATGSCGGTGTSTMVYKLMGRPVAGKSGTTDDNRSVWFVGMTPTLTAAGFIADPDNPFHTVPSGSRTKHKESVALMMRDALVGTPAVGFIAPSPALVGAATRPPSNGRTRR